MDIKNLIADLAGCPCSREHKVDIRAVEIGSGLKEKTAEILNAHSFPKKLLVVADKNTLAASGGIIEILESGGFDVKLKVYDNLRTADISDVLAVAAASAQTDGILSVGTGSLNDICRLAALRADKRFAIFATAPSMDGFASGTSPITENGFKQTVPARQPEIIIADTKILAASPAELKSAGFGDMIAKYIAVVDWRISSLVTGEYYCENVCNITRNALKRITALADKVTDNDEEAAGAVMEALVLTGLAMKLADCVRPASGTEHMISHFWEMKKLEQGIVSDFHGKKVGVATLITAKLYNRLREIPEMRFHADATDWARVYEAYGENFTDAVKRLNNPTVTCETTPEILSDNWQAIRRIIGEELPPYDELYSVMKRAGCVTKLSDIAVSPQLGLLGAQYHPYLRHRMTLQRLLPMMDYSVDYADLLESFI